jgi:hypothetical protein
VTEHTVRASELAEFVFCRRAWWYAQNGVASDARVSQERGTAWHAVRSRRAVAAARLANLGRVLVAASLVLLAAYLLLHFVS